MTIRCINNIRPVEPLPCLPNRNPPPNSADPNNRKPKPGQGPLYEEIRFNSGYTMTVVSQKRAESMQLRFDHDQAPVSFCYNLTQRARCTVTHGNKVKRTFERGAGDGVLAYLPETRGFLESPRGENVVGVSLYFPIETFIEIFSLTKQFFSALPPVSNGGHGVPAFYRQTRFNPETSLVLRQILQCPYEGRVRRLFMEAKSLELVSLKLAGLDPAKIGDPQDLNRYEMERTREAYQIVLDRLADPPNLMQLSRQVGLNRNKLNLGFKSLYGDTVFNVIRNAKMARALDLLRKTKLSLTEIAYSVGYNNQANFTTAFRSHFGQTPHKARHNGLSEPMDDNDFLT